MAGQIGHFFALLFLVASLFSTVAYFKASRLQDLVERKIWLRLARIGFALETNNIYENAIGKLKKKNFDLVVINSPNINEGFGYDTNKITIVDKDFALHAFPMKNKKDVAIGERGCRC